MRARLIIGCMLVVLAVGVCWIWLRPNRPVSSDRSRLESAAGSATHNTPTPNQANPQTSNPSRPVPSPSVQIVLNPQRNYSERVLAVNTLATNLDSVDWDALREFLLRPDPKDADPYGQAAKNQLLDRLCAMDPLPSELGDTLIAIYRDHTQDDVIRDYAVQHMAAYYDQLTLSRVDDAEVRNKIRGALNHALEERSTSIAGTALLALQRMSEGHPEIESEFVASEALKLARDGRTGELSRITAYQVCGRLGVQDSKLLLLDAAEHGNTTVLRISAVGALGRLGDADARPLLTALVNGPEERLRMPAQVALEQIVRHEQERAATN